LLIVLLPVTAHAAPKSEYWDIWDKHDAASTAVVDHSVWQGLLDKYLVLSEDGITRFDYKALQENDKATLDGYLDSLTSLDPLIYNKTEQMAYWVNLYNALTIKVIVDHYPVESILKINISPGFLKFGPWGKKLITVNGEELRLDDIEHRILRPIWQDPRIHYLVNCASIGCPNLHPQAYTADNIEELMTENAIAYINHPRGVSVKKGRVKLSTIYKWFKKDFGKNDKEVLDHIRQYGSDDLKAQLEGIKKIRKHGYDWDLNEVTTSEKES